VRPAGRLLVIACAALARELAAIRRLGGWDHVDVRCLPAQLHNRPEQICDEVRAMLQTTAPAYTGVFVAYADCGTGGRLDALLAEHGAERLPGAHCYEFLAGADRFAALHEAEPGTFYLTDFLVRNFDRLVIRGLGLDRHPELLPTYFGNYVRVVYLAQSRAPELVEKARAAAARLGLAFECRYTGLEPLRRLLAVVQPVVAP
jgi:hypothetical protein